MRVPHAGSDRLTDPSEIAALGKYLRKLKPEIEVSDVDIPGRAASELKNDLSSLEGSVERLESKEIQSLGDNILQRITGKPGEINSLGNRRVEAEGIKDSKDNKPSGNLEKLEGSIVEPNIGISERQTLPGVLDEIELSGDRKKLEGNLREIINEGTHLERLGVENTLESLGEGKREVLQDNRDISLSDFLIGLSAGNEEVQLNSNTESISGGRVKEATIDVEVDKIIVPVEKELDTKVEKVQEGPQDLTELPSIVESVGYVNDLLELPKVGQEIIQGKVIEEITTGNVRVVGEERIVSLEEKVEKIETSSGIEELTSSLERLEAKETPSLNNSIEKLREIPKVEGLGLRREAIHEMPVVLDELGNGIEMILGNKEVSLDTSTPFSLLSEVTNINDLPERAIQVGVNTQNTPSLADGILDVVGETNKDFTLSRLTETVREGYVEVNSLHDQVKNVEGEENKPISHLNKNIETITGSPDIEIELGRNTEKMKGKSIDPKELSHSTPPISGSSPEITTISKTSENIQKGKPKVDKLEENPEKIKGVTGVDNLKGKIEKVREGLQDTGELSKITETVPNRSNPIVELSTSKKGVGDIPEIGELSKGVVKSQGTLKDTPLSNVRKDLTGSPKAPDLIGDIKKIQGLLKSQEISGHKEKLEGVTGIRELSKDKKTITVTGDIESLTNTREGLGETLEVESLYSYLEGVEGETKKAESLSKDRETLTDSRENKLTSHRESLKDTSKIETLSDFLDTLDWENDNPLDNHHEKLDEVPEVKVLSDILVKGGKKEAKELSSTREDLTGISETESLSDHLDSLIGKKEVNTLYSDTIQAEKNDTSKINKGRVSGEGWEKDGTDDYNHEDFTGLDTTRLNLGGENKPTSLYEKVLSPEVSYTDGSIHEGWNGELDRSSALKKGVNQNENSFNPDTGDGLYSGALEAEENDTFKINVGANLTDEEDDYAHKGWEGELDDRSIKVGKNDTTKINVSNYKDGEYTGTSWKKENTDDPYEGFSKLGTLKVSAEKNDTSKINAGKNLADERDDYAHKGWSDDYIEELAEVLRSRKDLRLYYNNILKFAERKDTRSPWASKIQSLVSAYLSGDEISESRIQEFEKQLFNTIFTQYETDQQKVIKSKDSTRKKARKNGMGEKEEIGLANIKPSYVLEDENRSITTAVDSGETYPQDKKGKRSISLRNESAYVTKYKLEWAWRSTLDASQYLRWTAEQATFGTHGSTKALLLDTVLKALVSSRNVGERLIGSNRDRLPGGDNMLGTLVGLSQGDLVENAKIAARRIAKAGLDALTPDPNQLIDKSQPLNRPKKWEDTKAFQSGNKRKNNFNTVDEKEVKKSLGKALLGETKGIIGIDNNERDYNFKENYLNNQCWGIRTTLSELCGATDINSVEDLRTAIESSPIMTSASKVTTTTFNNAVGKVTTLDDNSNWEIVFLPYIGESNGKCSYLPSIREINSLNKKQFGLTTSYGLWIPFISFELNKSKMISKTLQLFDGEISYPVGMEYTNELRLTIADDQYKSWRRYFEMCANCAVYNSTLHDEGYYTTEFTEGEYITLEDKLKSTDELKTEIDKTFICPAPYKNITFRCLIYCMTPQKETIDKYDLLLVMKDFSEDRSGDIEPGGSDLTISFSIVGEHPSEVDNSGKYQSSWWSSNYYKNKNQRIDQRNLEKALEKKAMGMSILQTGASAAISEALDML